MLRIIYFARLRELLGPGEQIPLPEGVSTVAELRRWLGSRGEPWRRELMEHANLCVAVNHDYATDDRRLRSGDEVGFFPPVTGG
jgi:molybdopterin synthase sulfur carrier subunit